MPPPHSWAQNNLINAWDLRYDPQDAKFDVRDPLKASYTEDQWEILRYKDPSKPKFSTLPTTFPHLRFIVGACGTKFGKSLKIKELLPTPAGFRAVGDIQVGDYVFDENGKPVLVDYVTDLMYDHTCYDVVFSDGSVVSADADHWWVTETHACRKAHGDLNGVTSVKRRRKSTTQRAEKRTTEEIRKTLTVKVGGKLRPNHSVNLVSAPLQYPAQQLHVDPYVLGAWLGDGTACNNSVAGVDKQIFTEIANAGYRRYVRLCDEARGQLECFEGLTQDLRTIGVLNNKHVPSQYMIGSVEQRLSLLQGLMDTDGTISKRGDCSFYNTNEKLADAAYELVCSLGIKATRESREPKIDGSRHKKNGEVYPTCHIVHFTTDLPVFRLKRKLARVRLVATKAKRRYIVAVRPVPSEPVKCIRVVSPTHLFLVGKACIPTHNTYGCTIRLVAEAWNNPKTLNWWVAPTYAQAENAYVKTKELLPAGTYKEQYAKLRLTLLHPDGTERSVIEFKSGDDPATLRGFAVNFFIMDEAAQGMPQASFVSIMTTTTQTEGRGIIISTPNGGGWFYEVYQRGVKYYPDGTPKFGPESPDPFPEWFSVRMPTHANPHVKLEEVLLKRKQISETMFRQEYLAEFIKDANNVFKIEDLEAIEKYSLEGPQAGSYYVVGVDLAKHKDYTVLVVMDRKKNHVVYIERFNKISWDWQKRRILEVAAKYNKALICLDSTGVGDAIYDDLISAGYRPEHYKISGNEAKRLLIEKLKIAVENRTISYPKPTRECPTLHTLREEMEEYEYKYTPNGICTYSAPSGKHDDCVIALALAIQYVNTERFVYRHRQIRGI